MQLTEREGHRYATVMMTGVGVETLCDRAFEDIRALPSEAFDTLANPFESKLSLHEKRYLPHSLATLLAYMEGTVLEASRLFGVPALAVDATRHYAGVFRYPRGGHLSAHVDAGIHPATKQRKHITALVYLGHAGGNLQLWHGDNCTDESPAVDHIVAEIAPEHGRLVLFENNDQAWHAAETNESDHDRIVVTVSFLSDEVDRFLNKRERAYFVPRPGEEWTPGLYALRDKRAHPTEHASVYRTETTEVRM